MLFRGFIPKYRIKFLSFQFYLQNILTNWWIRFNFAVFESDVQSSSAQLTVDEWDGRIASLHIAPPGKMAASLGRICRSSLLKANNRALLSHVSRQTRLSPSLKNRSSVELKKNVTPVNRAVESESRKFSSPVSQVKALRSNWPPCRLLRTFFFTLISPTLSSTRRYDHSRFHENLKLRPETPENLVDTFTHVM